MLNPQNRKEASVKSIAMALMDVLPEIASPPLRVNITKAKINCPEIRG